MIRWSEVQPAGDTYKYWNDVSLSYRGDVMVAGEQRLWLSIDGGVTWNETQPDGDKDVGWGRVKVSSDGYTILAAGDKTLYKSIDRGDNWVEITLPDNSEFVTSSPNCNNLLARYAGGSPAHCVSTDGGDNWTDIEPTATYYLWWVDGVISDDGDTIMLISAKQDPNDGNRCFLSTDGGDSWTVRSDEGFPVADQYAASAISADGKTLINCYSNGRFVPLPSFFGLEISTDRGASWEGISVDDLGDMWFYPDYPEVAVSSNGKRIVLLKGESILASNDNGGNWVQDSTLQDPDILPERSVALSGNGAKGLICVNAKRMYLGVDQSAYPIVVML